MSSQSSIVAGKNWSYGYLWVQGCIRWRGDTTWLRGTGFHPVFNTVIKNMTEKAKLFSITYMDAKMFRYIWLIEAVNRSVRRYGTQHYGRTEGRHNTCTLRTARDIAEMPWCFLMYQAQKSLVRIAETSLRSEPETWMWSRSANYIATIFNGSLVMEDDGNLASQYFSVQFCL